MANGKNTPDCRYCRHYGLAELEPRTLAHYHSVKAPFCLFWKCRLPMLDCENRICADYDGPYVTSTEEFFKAFKVDARRGMLYRYFYNDNELKEFVSLAHPDAENPAPPTNT